MAQDPTAITLRYLQTLLDIGVENNTTVIFPVPLEMLKSFFDQSQGPETE
jgi:hypothetical protein